VGKKSRRVILDGAHNPEAARVLAQTIQSEEKNPVTLLFGVLKDKSVKPMAQVLAPLAKSVIVTSVPSDRSADPQKVAALQVWKKKAQVEIDGRQALKLALRENPETALVIAGSLYLIGNLRPLLKEKS
jgi:dihydrofolate synthase/folylpolyglutamate synthase